MRRSESPLRGPLGPIPWAALFAAVGRRWWFMAPWSLGSAMTFGPTAVRREV